MSRLLPLFLVVALLGACGHPKARDRAAATNNTTNMAAAPDAGADPQTDGTPGICDFNGWSTGKDAAGLSVRVSPSANAAIVGKLPPPVEEEQREWATGFDVVEARGGWFRIANVTSFDPADSHPLDISGWIEGRYLGFELQTDKSFAKPDPASPVVATNWADHDGVLHRFSFRNPTDCKGPWVRLSVTGHDGQERGAWARGVCGSQDTTCVGGVHDTHGDLIDPDALPHY